MAIEQKKNALIKLLDELKRDTDLGDEYVSMYQKRVKELPDWQADRYYERFIINKERTGYKSPAILFYRVLDHN